MSEGQNVAESSEQQFRAYKSSSLWMDVWRQMRRNRMAVAGMAILTALILVAILAPWITPQNPYDLAQVDVLDGRLPPGSEAFAGYTMWLGSDGAGRDLYSAILYGLRISISVGLASGVIAAVDALTEASGLFVFSARKCVTSGVSTNESIMRNCIPTYRRTRPAKNH